LAAGQHDVHTLYFPVLLQVKLVDAAFIWTEPHSRRLKTKLTVQKEVMNGAILQQTFQVEYVVEPHMCLDCNRANANPNSWTACVQVSEAKCNSSDESEGV
jgi:nonsense-mediated mRNA decay protein 3